MSRLDALAIALLTVPASAQSGGASCSFTFSDITQTSCDDRAPAIVVGSSGREHVAFYGDNVSGGRGRIYYTTRMPNQAWSTPLWVADSAFHAASLALDPNEAPYVTYSEASDQSERVRRLQGGTFVDLGTPLASGDFWKGGQGSKVAVDSIGRVFVAYFFGATEDARCAEWVNNDWSITEVETEGRVGKAMHLTLTPAGQPVMAYYHQDQDKTRVAERQVGGTWTYATRGGNGDPSDLAVLPNGDLVLVHRFTNQSAPM